MNRWISGDWNQAWETQYGFENLTGLCGFPIKVNAAYFTSDPKQMGAKYRSKNPVFLYVYTRWFTDAKSEKLRPRMFPSNANSEYISRFDDGALFSASLSRRYKELLYWFRRAARPTIYFFGWKLSLSPCSLLKNITVFKESLYSIPQSSKLLLQTWKWNSLFSNAYLHT